jgi:hypothetical protein
MSAPTLSTEFAVARLVALAEAKRAARSRPVAGERLGGFVLSALNDWPEPSPAWEQADAALKSFADELHDWGGLDLMTKVYDRAVERRGHRAVQGVSSSWDGLHGWMA